MVHTQALQAGLQPPHKFVSRAIRNLRCQPHFSSSARHYLADPRLALAIPVCIRRVQIIDAEINRSIQSLERLIFVLVHKEAAAASKCQNRNFGASSSQSPRRKRAHNRRRSPRVVFQERQTCASCSPQSNSLQKVSARELFAHGLFLDEPKPRWHSASYEFSSTRRE